LRTLHTVVATVRLVILMILRGVAMKWRALTGAPGLRMVIDGIAPDEGATATGAASRPT